MFPPGKTRPAGWHLHPREQRAILLMGDLIVAYLALVAAIFAWSLRDSWHITFFQQRVQTWYYFVPLFWLVLLVELYEPRRANSRRMTVRGIFLAALTGLIFYAFIYFFVPRDLARVGIGFFLVFVALFTLAWRMIYIGIFTAPTFLRKVLIIGAGKAGQTMAQAYLKVHPRPFVLVGFLDDDPTKVGKPVEGFPTLAGCDQLLAIIEQESISEVLVAITGEMQGDTFQTILDAQEAGVDIVPMPAIYEELLGRVPVQHLESDWLIRSFVVEARAGGFYEAGKRLLDVLGGVVGVSLSVILFPLAALLIVLDSGFPVFYNQIRSGRGAITYRLYKFRTMRQDAEMDGQARPAEENDERVTRVGGLLRRTHIDELPQFWNVLRGEMSIVGPRAERPELISKYQKHIPFYRARLMVKPGITGWAQINYGYSSTIPQTVVKLEYDLYYIKHRSLLMDLTIILRTIGQVIGLRGR